MADDDPSPKLISRKEAKALGLKHYFTGKPCKNGHVTQRRVHLCICLGCQRDRLSSGKWKQYQKRWQSENKDKTRAYTAQWTKRNLHKRKAYYEANKDKWTQSSRRRRAANPESQRAACRRWYAKNKDKNRIRAHKRRARKRSTTGTYLSSDVAIILKMQKGRCAYCRKKLQDNYHVDHIMPLIRGGTNERHNLQVLCSYCNLSKGTNDPIKYARKRGLLL